MAGRNECQHRSDGPRNAFCRISQRVCAVRLPIFRRRTSTIWLSRHHRRQQHYSRRTTGEYARLDGIGQEREYVFRIHFRRWSVLVIHSLRERRDGAERLYRAAIAVSTPSTPPPVITSLSISEGPVGTPVTISGHGFGATPGTNQVILSDMQVPVNSWSDTPST